MEGSLKFSFLWLEVKNVQEWQAGMWPSLLIRSEATPLYANNEVH